MKVFFDTNVYVAEALLGDAAERMLVATILARWRIFCSRYVLDETQRVLTEKLGFSQALGRITRERARRRATLVVPLTGSRHQVPHDPADSPILQAALAAGADYLVTNDAHLLALNPYQDLRIISLTEYFNLLFSEGHIVS
ncbi:MAG: putative toxin-antitoxin system toxin component, PIN family [Bythopirellula sp.]|nr:putative toxin-antitoxin system toxin component, PIN family [Bythopirellula sp.]